MTASPPVREGEPTPGPNGAASADQRRHPLVADAVHDSLSALERVLTGAGDGIALVGPDRRFAYASPNACQMLGRPLDALQGQDFLAILPTPPHEAAGRLPGLVGQSGTPFTCVVQGPGAAGREIVCSAFAVELAGNPHWVAIFRDLAGPRAGARTALALAQTAAQPVTGTTEGALAGIARHAVEGTRAVLSIIGLVGDDHKLAAIGGYGHPETVAALATWTAVPPNLYDVPGGDVLVTGRPIVLPDARTRLEADPRWAVFAATLACVDWQAVAYVPLSWEGRVFGMLAAFLPSGLDGPSGVELAFYAALAGQAAVAVTNARLAASAGAHPPGRGAARLGQPGTVLDDHARPGRPAGDDPNRRGPERAAGSRRGPAGRPDPRRHGRDAGPHLRAAPGRAGRGGPGGRPAPAGRGADGPGGPDGHGGRPRGRGWSWGPGPRSTCTASCWRPCTTWSSTPGPAGPTSG